MIVVNATHGGERQRFTIAHEIGHLVLDVSPGIDEEKVAHRFAGAFLMPEEVMWAEIGKHRTALGWAELFKLKLMLGVSVQAITYRCNDLGIISQTLKDRMYSVFEEIGWRSPPYEGRTPDSRREVRSVRAPLLSSAGRGRDLRVEGIGAAGDLRPRPQRIDGQSGRQQRTGYGGGVGGGCDGRGHIGVDRP